MRRAAWSWVIGLVNAALLAFLGYSFALYGFPDSDLLPVVVTLLVAAITNLAGLYWLKPREEERLALTVQMAELRKRLAAVATPVKQVAGRPPVSRRASLVTVGINAIVLLVVLKFSVRDGDSEAGVLLTAIPSLVTIMGVYMLWASDELSMLRRELRRAQLLAQLKALQ